ncbi:protein of unknown function [Maridesulfovibrio ferrireducens]|uniref:DUF4301 domain-containing protein n=1 Tax=Maridesulfovibrio ferrireducens TaxID=246191 RepID=A0A1G9HCF2_9BACT|nr:DUF4301 family protein [Maridesulfovibrio ferrireducens]SDL10525.1 protein of unknown function [Maridesulfovibrio ferrireducens]
MSTEKEFREVEKKLQNIIGGSISARVLADQFMRLKKGFPATNLERSCTLKDGISIIPEEDRDGLIGIFNDAVDIGRITKFVPASGAATRMFKFLLEFLKTGHKNFESNPDCDEASLQMARTFVDSLSKFAFYGELKESMKQGGEDLDECLAQNDCRTILEYLLTEKGLNYSQYPKGLIPFHVYGDGSRTPFEEHILEAIEYAKDEEGKIRLHFTIAPDNEKKAKKHIAEALGKFPEFDFDISYSEQSRKTDTIAVDLNNEIFRTDDNKVLFRPAGHGALLVNLNELKGDIVFLKNIDNVVPDNFKADTIEYKKLLGGLLVLLQSQIFDCIKMLKKPSLTEFEVAVTSLFVVTRLHMTLPADFVKMPLVTKAEILISRLNKPIRVCGMVKNQGEPGGGPFWVVGSDGIISPQIVEKSQVDMDSSKQVEILKSSTHFNPVDIVCGLRDYRGRQFDLMKFTDPETGFISYKSEQGRKLKALELPGLWNGSMADWLTVFVEVPLSTFSPVKTVNDLLKDEHQL